MKAAGWLTLALILAFFGYTVGSDRANNVKVAALRDTVRITDTLYREAKAEAKTAVAVAKGAKGKSDSSSAPVAVVNDSTIYVTRAETTIVAVVPPEITKNITDLRATVKADSVAILKQGVALWRADSTIRARDQLQALTKPPRRIGLGVGLGLACAAQGCGPGLSVGVTIRVR